MTHKILLTILSIAITSIASSAQTNVAILYGMNFPTGDTKDFIEKPSFRGASVEFRNYIAPEVSLGLSTGWYTFYERKSLATYTTEDESTAVSGVQYRYMNSIPILAMVDYHFNPSKSLSPFVGLTFGTTYNRFDNDMGIYEITVDTWHFTLAPQAGLKAGSGESGMWGFISGRYNHNFGNSEADTQNYITLSVGFLLEF